MKCGLLLLVWTFKKRKTWSVPRSIEKCMLWGCVLMQLKKRVASYSELKRQNVSSTYRRQNKTFEFLYNSSHLFSKSPTSKLATTGSRGKPIATPSTWSYKVPLKRKRVSSVANSKKPFLLILAKFEPKIAYRNILNREVNTFLYKDVGKIKAFNIERNHKLTMK